MDSELLVRYVTGEASTEERLRVERWAASDAAHARELQELQHLWSIAGAGEGAAADVDVDAAWSRLDARIAEADGRGRVVPLWRVPVWRWVAAAAVTVGLFFGVRVLLPGGGQDYLATTAFVHVALKDSSHVVLSPGTALQARMGAERRIALKGEAYFEVERDTAHPFVVEAEGLTVTVLGTGFTVTAYDTCALLRVRVRHGHVRVRVDTAEADLLAGDEVLYDRAAKRLVRQEVPSSVVWGDRIVQFERAPMAEVVERLNVLFHVRVELCSPAQADRLLTASFDNEPIEEVLGVIATTFKWRVERADDGHYILAGDGC